MRQTQKYKKIRVLSFSNLLFFIAYAAYPTVFVNVSFVFVAQIKFQVEAYLCRHLKFTNTQIENGHFVVCKCASV